MRKQGDGTKFDAQRAGWHSLVGRSKAFGEAIAIRLAELGTRVLACRRVGGRASAGESHLGPRTQRLGVRHRPRGRVVPWDRRRRCGGGFPTRRNPTDHARWLRTVLVLQAKHLADACEWPRLLFRQRVVELSGNGCRSASCTRRSEGVWSGGQ